MLQLNRFGVGIERRRIQRFFTASLLTLTLIGALFAAPTARAQVAPLSKFANDLLFAPVGSVVTAVLSPLFGRSSAAPALPSWVKDINGVRYYKVLLVSDSSDPDLVDLRSSVLAAGGSVYYRYLSVRALSVMLPASSLAQFAARSDVQSISPNRPTARTASSLELATGASTSRTGNGNGVSKLDGTGVGIAVLDSGIAWNHYGMRAANQSSRVKRAVDFLKTGDASAVGVRDWTPGIDVSSAMVPGSSMSAGYEAAIKADRANRSDAYGHGSHVASVAAGRAYRSVDSTGVAPNASLFDVKVLDESGNGQLSDVLAGIDWVIYHAAEYNIRVMNLSLAADSSETYLTDPLCRAVRSAAAAGITVVVAAGNYGKSAADAERYGSIGAPGNDPSVITVGSVNTRGTALRADDTVNLFSSRGPTRSSYFDVKGMRRFDNLLKPDLVAPGNKIVGALATNVLALPGTEWSAIADANSSLSSSYGGRLQLANQGLMNLSGTSIAAPVVSGTVALMLQANPGLTPPLIKAMLQYSAQPLANANLLQQGAGELNVEGAVKLASALRTDIGPAITAGTIATGASMLAAGKTLPAPSSTLNGETVPWSRMVFAGGTQVLGGPALFANYQPIYDPRLVWVGKTALRTTVTYWPAASGVPARTFPKWVTEKPAGSQGFVTAGVLSATALAGTSSKVGRTGVFIPTATLSGWVAVGSGTAFSQGIVMSEGIVLSEGVVMSEGIVLSEAASKGEP